jgi:hypothetical protein
MVKKEGKEILIKEQVEQQSFDLGEYFDFNGPLITIQYSADTGTQTNFLIQRQRVIETSFKHLKEEYSGVIIRQDKGIVWQKKDSVAKFLVEREEQSQIVQELTGQVIGAELLNMANGTAYCAIMEENSLKTLYVNFEGNALSTTELDAELGSSAKIVMLNPDDQKFVIAWYNGDTLKFSFQKVEIKNNELIINSKLTKNMRTTLFDYTIIEKNSHIQIFYTFQSIDQIQSMTLEEDQEVLKISSELSFTLDLGTFDTYFYGRTGRITCSAGASDLTLECAVSDSIFNAFLVDISLDANNFPTAISATHSFIIPAGFDVMYMIRSGTNLYWSGVKSSSIRLPKLGTVLDSDYLLLLFQKDVSVHAVMTLTPDDTGVLLSDFDDLSPFLTTQGENSVFNYISGNKSSTETLGAVLVDKFEWVVNDPKQVQLAKDKFDAEGYDPEEKQEVVVEEVAEKEKTGNGNLWLILIICLLVIALITCFTCCCVYGGGKRRRKKEQEEIEPVSIGGDKLGTRMLADQEGI